MEIDQMWEGERAKFEAEIVEMNDDPAMLERWPGGAYKHHGVDGRWSGWKMACRASRPAEVNDEGLPALPKKRGTIYPGNYWTDCDEADPPGVPLADIYTAEQFRQGQREAVAADRARRGEPVAYAVVSQKGGIHKLAVTRSSAERKAAIWKQEWPNNGCMVRPLAFADSLAAPSHTTNKEK